MIGVRNTSSSFLWLWWRRQAFYLRQLPFKWVLFLGISILLLIAFVPNPFSSDYSIISISQDVQWSSITDLLKRKENVISNDPLSNEVKVINPGNDQKQFTKPILILLYTTIFLNKRYCLWTVDRIFGTSCPSKNQCQWSCDRRQLFRADAIIFHAPDIQFFQATVPKRSETKPDSIWILWSDEPPSLVSYSLFNSYEFNWTISYKLTSEVSIGAYGLFTKRDLTLSNADYNRWIEKQFQHRLNGALWFVSNCDSKKRLNYYHKLRQYPNTTVEGYGRCVDYYPMHFCTSNTRCEFDYMSKYKYYLSFESTTCRDYITEKFYKALYYGLIPVIYGPDANDYNNLAPPHSFIHIKEFDNDMGKLANYLRAVHSNFDLYTLYHQWRKKYEVIIDGKAIERIRMCELCERLNRVRQNEVIYYKDVEKFYREKCD